MLSACIALAFFAAATAHAAKKDEPPDPRTLPWTLRDHYQFTSDNVRLDYAQDNAEWRLTWNEDNQAVSGVTSRVTLADGTSFMLDDAGLASSSRDRCTTLLGGGCEYAVKFPSHMGLTVQHSLTMQDEHPFYLIRVTVTNTSDAPIGIAKISPVVLGPGSITGLSDKLDVHTRHLVTRGGCPVFDRDAPPCFVLIRDRRQDITLALGLFQTGAGESGVDLKPFEGNYQGEVSTTFDPPITLKPGDSVAADPAWLTFSVQDPDQIDTFHGWTLWNLRHPEAGATLPESWVTVEDGESASKLAEAMRFWARTGVKHALVPGTWEGRPGSLDGAEPDYPRNISKIAGMITAVGMEPGISVNPLAVQGGDPEWTVASDDGQPWMDPTDDAARAFGVKRMRELKNAGFTFFVVYPSHIPDTVLRHFNLTRAQADDAAFDIVDEAVGDAPVFASSATTLRGGFEPWLEAAAATNVAATYGAAVAPVRLDAPRVEALDDDAVAAMRLFRGPIEFVGAPSAKIQRRLASLLAKPRMRGRPQDVASRIPRKWRIDYDDGKAVGKGVRVFPSAKSRDSSRSDQANSEMDSVASDLKAETGK
jgi:hypothetical protein